MVKEKDMHFFKKNLKIKKEKRNDPPEWGFQPQIFSNFPVHDLNFHVKVRSPRSNQNKLLKEVGL